MTAINNYLQNKIIDQLLESEAKAAGVSAHAASREAIIIWIALGPAGRRKFKDLVG